MSGRKEKSEKERQYENELKQIFAKRFKTACQKKFDKNQDDEIGTKELFEIFKYVYPERATLYLNDKNSAVPTLRKWLNGESLPEYAALLKLCDEACLNCSLDYLLGRIECTTHDIQFIHKYTHLSEDSIDILAIATSRYSKAIDIILKNIIDMPDGKPTRDFIDLFSNYIMFNPGKKEYAISHDGDIIANPKPMDIVDGIAFKKANQIYFSSEQLEQMFIMEMEDTLKAIKKEQAKLTKKAPDPN